MAGAAPGVGALSAIGAAGLSLGIQYAWTKYQQEQQYYGQKDSRNAAATTVDRKVVLASHESGQGQCVREPCYGVGVQWIQRQLGNYPGTHDPYNFFLDIFCDCKLEGMFFNGSNHQIPGIKVNIPTKIPLEINVGLGRPVTNFYLEIYGPLGTGRLDIPFRWAPPKTRALPHTAI